MRVKKGEFWSLFFGRMLVVALLVLFTYNLTGFSYYHWVTASSFEGFGSTLGAAKVAVGLLVMVCFLLLFRATWRAKGPAGMIVTLVIFAAVTYFIWTFGVIDLSSPTVGTVIVQLFLIVLLAVGSIWSYVWKYMTGQVTVIDDDSE